MGLDPRRLRHLEAMGITVWERRDRGAHESGVGTAAARHSPVRSAPPADVTGMDWEALEAEIRSCQRCPLHASRTQAVVGVGDRAARWMIVGEAPGAEEDRRGEPFVGRAGQLLDEMLRAVGLDRSGVYITNILKSRPPKNRDPKPEEVSACSPFLQRQIELIQPALILAVGRVSAQLLLATDAPLGRLRGKVHSYGHQALPTVVTYHPAYLLRSPDQKAKAWADLCLARATAASVLG